MKADKGPGDFWLTRNVCGSKQVVESPVLKTNVAVMHSNVVVFCRVEKKQLFI